MVTSAADLVFFFAFWSLTLGFTEREPRVRTFLGFSRPGGVERGRDLETGSAKPVDAIAPVTVEVVAVTDAHGTVVVDTVEVGMAVTVILASTFD